MSTATAVYPDIFNPDLETGPDLPTGSPGELRSEQNVLRKRLYIACGYLFRHSFNVLQANAGVYPATSSKNFDGNFTVGDRNRFAAVYGHLWLTGFEDPSLGRLARGFPGARDIFLDGSDETGSFGKEPVGDPNTMGGWTWSNFRVLIVPEFVAAFQDAFRTYTENASLYDQAFTELLKQAVGRAAPGALPKVNARDLAAVTQRLITRGVSANDPYINLQIQNALSQTLGGVIDGAPSALSLEPPDLDTVAAIEIIPDNVRAVRLIYYSSQLEE